MASFTLYAETGSFALHGAKATVLSGQRILAGDSGVFALTGSDADLTVTTPGVVIAAKVSDRSVVTVLLKNEPAP